jgi:hypothetical protein
MDIRRLRISLLPIPDNKIDHQKGNQREEKNSDGQDVKENLIDDFSG